MALVPRVSRSRSVPPPPALVAIGDLLLDIVVRAGAPVERGTDVPGDIRFRQGGSAANVVRSFVRLGGRGVLVCSVGRDGWGQRLVAALRADGGVVRAVPAQGATGRLTALVDPDGERSFVTERGAAEALRGDDLRASWFRGAGVLHIPAYSLFHQPLASATARAAEMAHVAGSLVSVDLASAGPLRAFGATAARDPRPALAPDLQLSNPAQAPGHTRPPPPALGALDDFVAR
ncbi:MAG: carbohydrate kinase family protein, partial [Chloroflexi bacterium]|nr:carbohydrate kinase family protein [Chloroflexota bacterium]